MRPSSDELLPVLARREGVSAIRLVGDADAVEWVAENLESSGLAVEALTVAGPADGAPGGSVVWIARPGPSDGGGAASVDPAVWTFPCLIVVPPGGELPSIAGGNASVESFDVVRQPEDGPTLRIRLERLLHLHRRRSQTEVLLQNLRDAVYTRRLDGTVTSVNAAAERLIGRSRGEIVGHSIDGLLPATMAPGGTIEETNAILETGERYRSRLDLPGRDGRRLVFDAEAALLRDGRDLPWGVQIVLHDVTEQLEAEERLRREATRHEILAEIATVTRDERDLDRILATAAEILGSRLGARTADLWLVEEDRSSYRLRTQWAASPEIPDIRGTVRTVAESTLFATISRARQPYPVTDRSEIDPPDWAVRTMERLGARSWIAVPIQREGQIAGVLGLTFADPRPFPPDLVVFLQRAADQVALALHSARLHRELQDKLAALAEAQRRRDEADQQRRNLTSMLVHDLKNPLSAVIASLDIALDKLPADDRLGRMLRNSLASAQRLQGLIEDALLVYRPDDAPGTGLAPAAPAEVLSTPLEEARWLAEFRQVSLSVEIPPDLPRVPLDVTRYRRAASNLLSNAIKFSPRGGAVAVSAALRPDGDGRALVLSVFDTGPGLPGEALPDLATPWRRFAGSEAVPGTGLGLAVVQKVAQLHRGRLEARPRPDATGSVFSLWVPA